MGRIAGNVVMLILFAVAAVVFGRQVFAAWGAQAMGETVVALLATLGCTMLAVRASRRVVRGVRELPQRGS